MNVIQRFIQSCFLYGDHNKKSAAGSIALSLILWLIRLLWSSYSTTDLNDFIGIHCTVVHHINDFNMDIFIFYKVQDCIFLESYLRA